MSLLLLFGAGTPAVASYPPTLKVEIAFPTAPLAASPTWTDVSAYVAGASMKRGRNHELNRVDRGSARVVLDDADRRFDPLNTASPYSPNVLPLKKVRITLDDGVTLHRRFTGFVERWPMEWEAPGLQFERTLDCCDAFEFLSQYELITTQATLTTTLAANKNLKFTAKGAGVAGNAISVEYHILDDRATYYPIAYLASEVEELGTAETSRIIVVLGTTVAGATINSSAREVMYAIKANPACAALVDVEIPAGENGKGVVTTMARTYLSGGEYAQELSSTRIGNVLDDIGYPSGGDHRSIQTGQYSVAAAGFLAADRQNALEHVQETVEAEGGVFFADGSGKAVFHDVHYRWKGARLTPSVTFGDSGSEIPYEDIVANFDRDEIRTEARVGWAGSNDPETYSDATAQTNYGKRTITQSLSLVSEHAAEARASYLVEAYKSPKIRFDKITVRPLDSATIWAALLPLEIGDRVTVKRRPAEHPAGSAVVISQDCFIESIELTLGRTPEDATFVLGLTPCPWASFWLIGDATYGQLGVTSRLGI